MTESVELFPPGSDPYYAQRFIVIHSGVKSVRLAADQERRLREAAVRYGVTESEFIRTAIDRACEEALAAQTPYEKIEDLIDTLHLGGGVARRHHEGFAEAVEAKFARIRAENDERRRGKPA